MVSMKGKEIDIIWSGGVTSILSQADFEKMLKKGNIVYGWDGTPIESYSSLIDFFELLEKEDFNIGEYQAVLVWESAEDAIDKDGSTAIATITMHMTWDD